MTSFAVLPIIRNQVRWACRRGMLELDWLLLRFFEAYYDTLDEAAQRIFFTLLTEEDPVLHAWLTQKEEAPEKYKAIVAQIIAAQHDLDPRQPLS